VNTSAACLLGAAFVALLSTAASAQTLELRRDRPEIAWAGCPQMARPANVAQQRRDEAARLATAATESAILGDNAAARDLLARAAATDPTAPSHAYRLGRALEELGRTDEALGEYCRYLAIAPNAADAGEVRTRITALTRPAGLAVPESALHAFDAGIADYDAARLVEAEAAFRAAAEAAPYWPAPVFNRALVFTALDRRDDAAVAFRNYLELSPGASDFDAVLALLASFREGPAPVQRYNPGSALVAGLLVPGLGHFTTGRPGRGALFMTAAGAAVAAALLVEKVDVDCLSPPVGGVCPTDQILNKDVSRPLLLPGLGAAAVIGIVGAVDAFRGAQRKNATDAGLRMGMVGDRGVRLQAPGINAAWTGIRIDLLRVRF
jgi:tetratricopeptide (TPR) repeat protein